MAGMSELALATSRMEIIDCVQGEEAWFRARLGIVTASRLDDVMAKGRNGGESLSRGRYLRTLAGEIITGEPGEQFTTPAMERGKQMEAEARLFYALAHDADPEIVGFIRNGQVGCSPDALLGSDGLLEIKTKRADILIECLLRDEFPADHKAQCQGAIWIAERDFVDIACYWPGLPLFVKRGGRDEKYIKEISEAVDRFNEELARLVERVRAYGVAQ